MTKDLSNEDFYYIDQWGETLASIEWQIRAYNQHTIQATQSKYVSGRDMTLKTASVIDWRFIIPGKQKHVDNDDMQENDRQVTHDYAISYLVY